MMIKKFCSAVLTIVFIATACISAYAAIPQSIVKQSEDYGYYDDFSLGTSMWTMSGALREDGYIKPMASSSLLINTADEEYEIYDGGVKVDFKIDGANEGLFWIALRGTREESYSKTTNESFRVSFRANKVYYHLPGSAKENYLCDYTLADNTEYSVLIEVKGNAANISIGKQNEYDKTASLDIGNSKKGHISVFSNPTSHLMIKAMEIFDYDSKILKFNKKFEVIKQGASQRLAVHNETGKELIWKSSDETIAEVDENGNVTVNSPGNVKITASAKDGSLSDYCNVSAYVPIRAAAFYTSLTAKHLYTGEKMLMQAQWEPWSATNTSFKWENSNPEVAELIGKNNYVKTLRGLQAGTTVISFSNGDGPVGRWEVTVEEKPEPQTAELNFSIDGSSKKIPDMLFGAHWAILMDYGANASYRDRAGQDKWNEAGMQVIKDVGFKHIRSYNTWWDYTTGTRFEEAGGPGPNNVTLKEVYDVANELELPQVLSFSTISTVDECIEELKLVMSYTDKPIYIEYGNETYAINQVKTIPSVEVYVEKLKELYTRAKEICPNCKIGVPILSYVLYNSIFNDPGNYPDGEENWEYTQGIRALTWNAVLSQNSRYFDAIIPHMYSSIKPWSEPFPQYDAVKWAWFRFQADIKGAVKDTNMFKNKEIWVTEYSSYPPLALPHNSRDELYFGKDFGYGLPAAVAALTFMSLPNYTISSYGSPVDMQGFGLCQQTQYFVGDLVYLPRYYMFRKIGEVVNKYDHVYGVSLAKDGAELREIKMNQGSEIDYIQNVMAFGFGDENEIKQIVFCNISENPANIKIDGSFMKKTWQYYSENPMPNYLENKSGVFSNAPSEVPLPEEEDGEYSEAVEIKPYSITVVDVSAENAASMMSESLKQKLENGMVFKADSNVAYQGTARRSTTIYDSNMIPYSNGHEVMIPIRYATDLMYASTAIENSTDDSYEVRIKILRDLSEDAGTKNLDISNVTSVETGLKFIKEYYFNSVFKVKTDDVVSEQCVIRDEEYDLTGMQLPQIKDGILYVPASIVGKIFNKQLTTYGEYAIFTKIGETLSAEELLSLENEFKRYNEN